MPTSHADGYSHHPERVPERSDRVSDRPENTPDTGHILRENTPEDRRAAYVRHDAGRSNGAADAALPQVHIVNVDAINHTQISMTPFNRNHGGNISRGDLEQTIGDPRTGNMVGANQAAVGLLRNFDAIASLNPGDGVGAISSSDMARLHRLPPENPLARQINRDMAAVPGYGLNEGLFDRQRGVTPDAVRESNQINDSAVMSAATSLAGNERGRQFILQRVEQDGNNFRVRLGNGQTITTPRPSSPEMGVYGQDSRHGVWPNVLERAVGMSIHDDPLRPQAAVERLMGQQVVRSLFGNSGNQTHLELQRLSDDALHTRLSNISPNAMLMTADLGAGTVAAAERVDARGRYMSTDQLTAGHTYPVDHYDAAARTVYLRNPQHEMVRMPLYSFRQNFLNFDSVQPPW